MTKIVQLQDLIEDGREGNFDEHYIWSVKFYHHIEGRPDLFGIAVFCESAVEALQVAYDNLPHYFEDSSSDRFKIIERIEIEQIALDLYVRFRNE